MLIKLKKGFIFTLVFVSVLSEDELNLSRGAVVTNGFECARIGRNILIVGGSAVDAAIAAGLCEGLALPQSLGIGGGFLMTIYKKSTGKVETLNAREVAPLAATPGMFNGDPALSFKGGLSVAVPGELRGYEEVHRKYGKLPWAEVLRPIIKLCRDGILVTTSLERTFIKTKEILMGETMREVFIDPETNEPHKVGFRLKRPQLQKTFELLAEEGANAIYNGTLTKALVQDIQEAGGILTEEDMNSYRPQWLEPVKMKLLNTTLFSMPAPGSGLVVSYILDLVKDFLHGKNKLDLLTYHRIIESFKHGYAKRSRLGDPFFTKLDPALTKSMSSIAKKATRHLIATNETSQDPEFYGAHVAQQEDHGTANLCVLAPNGDAVVISGTLNLLFGSQIRSKRTGIILNNQMDDFSSNFPNAFGVAPSIANFIAPGKRPMSSMCPSILLGSDGNVRLLIGGSGGIRIISEIAWVIIKHLMLGDSLPDAVASKRLHHQLLPMVVTYESGFDKEVINYLKSIGHRLLEDDFKDDMIAVTAISNVHGHVSAAFDPRRGGSIKYV